MEEKKKKEMTPEELKNAAGYWANEAKFWKEKAEQLHSELAQSNMFNTFKGLDYLFKVLEQSNCFKDGFVIKCADKIQEFLEVSVFTEDSEEKTSEPKK